MRDGLALKSDIQFGSYSTALMKIGNELGFYHAPITASRPIETLILN